MHILKVVAVLVVLTAVIAVSSIYVQSHMAGDAHALTTAIDKVEENISKGDWQAAKSELSEIGTRWDKTKAKWAVLIDHAEIDNIEATLTRMEASVAQKDAKISLPEAAVLKQYINHIPAKENLEIKNVL